MAEKMYCPLDRKYSSKVEQREAKVIKQIVDIDCTITALRESLVEFPQANETLLSIDWQELISAFSPQSLMTPIEQERFDNVIKILEIIKRQLKTQRSGKTSATIW